MKNINIPDEFMGIKVDEAMDRFLKRKDAPAQAVAKADVPVNVHSTKDFWRLENVLYRNKICTVDLAKSLLDKGNSKTQDDWANYREQAIKSNEFYTGDMPLYHAVFASLFNQKDKPESEEARKFIQKQMRSKYPMTLTRIAYQPSGEDKIIHNYGTKEKYEINASIVGPDRAILDGDKSALTALLSIDNVKEIKAVYNWINETPTWIWRLNNTPGSIDERVAGFGAGSGGAGLGCSWGPGADASLGVRLVVRPKGDAFAKN